MENCIFCKILNKEIPCYKIYENEYVLAFLDNSKDVDGHTLVVPKIHYNNMIDCSDKYIEEVFKAVKLISSHYVNKLGYEGVNIINNNNEVAEQTVLHLHVHIIPRKKNDNLHIFPELNNSKLSLEESQKFFEIK